MSNVFDPMLLETAMEPFPCLETMRLEMTSGTEVPTARKVSPITESGTPIVNPITVIIHVSTYLIGEMKMDYAYSETMRFGNCDRSTGVTALLPCVMLPSVVRGTRK